MQALAIRLQEPQVGGRLKPTEERRLHPRSWSLLGRARVAARLRTGSPLRVLNMSPDGLLVESPARLLPGRQVELMLQSGTSWEQAPWVVIHSRVGCIRGSADLRYRAGLCRVPGTIYPRQRQAQPEGKLLPVPAQATITAAAPDSAGPAATADGTQFDHRDRT
jgi:hypothetical protein